MWNPSFAGEIKHKTLLLEFLNDLFVNIELNWKVGYPHTIGYPLIRDIKPANFEKKRFKCDSKFTTNAITANKSCKFQK